MALPRNSPGALQKEIAATLPNARRTSPAAKDSLTEPANSRTSRKEAGREVLPAPAAAAALAGAPRRASPVRSLRGLWRDRSDAIATKRPASARASSSPTSARSPRSWRARPSPKNFYEAGGIEGCPNDRFASADAATDAFARSGAAIACICSSDALYAPSMRMVAAPAR